MVVIVVTMVTTDVLNNVAAAVLAAPIAIGTAERLDVITIVAVPLILLF